MGRTWEKRRRETTTPPLIEVGCLAVSSYAARKTAGVYQR